MIRWLIFCAGEGSKKFASRRVVEFGDTVVAFLDNSPSKQGGDVDGVKVFPPSKTPNLRYDRIAVPEQHYREAVEQLSAIGVDSSQVVQIDGWNPQIRKDWLSDYAGMMGSVPGNVAEVGVFRGDFALCINVAFPGDPLYLFDTFEGFPESDVQSEMGNPASETHKYDATSVEYVLSRLPHPERAVIRKGYFPDTAVGLPDGFKFVNLDLDLYAPTLAGLRLFYPNMVNGGVLLVHDYFSDAYPGVKRAVAEFERDIGNMLKVPIGDKISIAILKWENT